MKKWLIFPLILTIVGVAWAGKFYYNNLRGAGPAFAPAPQDITKILPEQLKPGPAQNATGLPLHLPDGFSITIFAKNLTNARVLAWDPKGRLLVSETSAGKVVALEDANGDG